MSAKGQDMSRESIMASFSEFKFYQSFRIPIQEADDLRFLVELDGANKGEYIKDARLVDVSINGIGFSSQEKISVGQEITISLHFRKDHLDLNGCIVRAFSNGVNDERIIYGIELEEETKIKKFLEHFLASFSSDRLRECLMDSALKERYTKTGEGFEMFSLLLSLFKDITRFGDREGFIDNMLDEVVRILNAQRASIFLINPDSNELEAYSAMGVNKDQLKFDYRLGVAGSVFTTGVALNINTSEDQSRFNEVFDKRFNFKTSSIICYPIHNREDKIVGVMEVLNKRNQDRFTVDDEKTMKVLALIFSAVFHGYNPVSEISQIRRFSTPFDREYALIGRTNHIVSLRNAIIRTKDLNTPLLISGEAGVGKMLYARILHHEGNRGLKPFEEINCVDKNYELLSEKLWSLDEEKNQLIRCQGGTLVFREIGKLSLDFQEKLLQVIKENCIQGSKYTLDVRMVATTSLDLGKLVDEGAFKKDLYEFFFKTHIHMEPLRRHLDDLPILIDYFLKVECKKQGFLLKSFAPKLIDRLKNYDWPANIKELRLCVERAVLYSPKNHIISDVDDLSSSAAPLVDISAKNRMFGDVPYVSDFRIALKDRLAIIEREMIIAEIKRNNGNKSKASKEMGISREALRKKLLSSREILEALKNAGTLNVHAGMFGTIDEDFEDDIELEKKAA